MSGDQLDRDDLTDVDTRSKNKKPPARARGI
jgi:hypothetical protein